MATKFTFAPDGDDQAETIMKVLSLLGVPLMDTAAEAEESGVAYTITVAKAPVTATAGETR